MQGKDLERWLQFSSQLDELLELDPAARRERVAALHADDPERGAALQSLLAGLTALDASDFLHTPAPLLGGGLLAAGPLAEGPLAEGPLAEGVSGQVVGAYTLERELGRGGMSSVWLAKRTDGRYEARVAIKFLNLGLVPHGGAERFAREGNILARLAHLNIARLIDAGVTPGQQPYLVLEYVDGEPIDRHCERHSLGTRARVRLFLDVLAAVAHAHNRLILHRDLKPGNILVTAAGEVKLLDFGIAKLIDDAHRSLQQSELTQWAGRPCTLAYAAPEQLEGGDVTTATDVYALGVLLYLLLGRRHPTLNSKELKPLEQLRALLETEPPPASEAVVDPALRRELRGELDVILAKALQKSSSERYANASAFADDLQRYLSDLPIRARADTFVYRAVKFGRRHRFGIAASAAVALTLAGGVTAAMLQAREVHVEQGKAAELIEFMLGDLRDKLQPVGRLDALDAVGAKALAYYDVQSTRLLDEAALGRHSRALHLVGEIAELRGNLDQAAMYFRSAAASTADLLRREPDQATNIFNHAQSVYWVGYVAWRRGLLSEARSGFDEYLRLARRLIQLDATNIDWQVEEGHAHQNLGVVLLDQGDIAAALREFQQARQRFDDAVLHRPALRATLISAHGWTAKAKEALGDLGGAIEEIRTQVVLQHDQPDTNNRRVQQAVAVAESELARLELYRGAPGQARQYALSAVRLLEALVDVDPANQFWAEQLAWAHMRRAEAEQAQSDLTAARRSLRNAQTVLDALLAKDREAAGKQATLIGRMLVVDAELAAQSRRSVSTTRLQRWLDSLRSQPLVGRRQYIAGQAHLILGDALARKRKTAAARQQWQEGVQLLGQQSDPMSLTVLAQLQLRLGNAAAVGALAARIARTDFEHPAYLDLQQRFGATRLAAK